MKITGKISIVILAVFLIGFALKSRYNLTTNVSEYAVKTADVANGQQNKEDVTIYYAAEANTVILSFPQSQIVSCGTVFFVHPNSMEKNRTFTLKSTTLLRPLFTNFLFRHFWIKSEVIGARSVRQPPRSCHALPSHKHGIRFQGHIYVYQWSYPLDHTHFRAMHPFRQPPTILIPLRESKNLKYLQNY